MVAEARTQCDQNDDHSGMIGFHFWLAACTDLRCFRLYWSSPAARPLPTLFPLGRTLTWSARTPAVA
jgi:hypothetical protein